VLGIAVLLQPFNWKLYRVCARLYAIAANGKTRQAAVKLAKSQTFFNATSRITATQSFK
jgi:hypothetical protein